MVMEVFLVWIQDLWKNNDNHRIFAQWLFLTCRVKFPFVAKVAWQLLQENFFPLCLSWCLARAPDPEKDLPQISHLYDSVCVFLCFCSKVFDENFLWQLSHSHWPQLQMCLLPSLSSFITFPQSHLSASFSRPLFNSWALRLYSWIETLVK